MRFHPRFAEGLRRAFGIAQGALAPIERRLAGRADARSAGTGAPVFIVGPPRSGSTLLYDALAESMQFSYFSNLTAEFYAVPVIGAYLSRALPDRRQSRSHEISYGHVPGLKSPSECGKFWYRWFPRP